MNLSRILMVPVWLAGLWGSLHVHKLDLLTGHDICGRWGCGPPLEALIGYHSFWTMILVPCAVVAGWYLAPSTSRRVGLAVLLASIVGTVAYVSWDVFNYFVQAESTQYLVQRGLFTLVTTVDVPMIPTIFAGLVLTFWFGARSNSVEPEPASPFEHGTEPATL